jgi:hypothetical protein
VEWLWMTDAAYDLRLMYIECDTVSKHFKPSVEWSACHEPEEVSPITNTRVCYRTESLKYAQTSAFTAIIFSQLANILCCKTKFSSII